MLIILNFFFKSGDNKNEEVSSLGWSILLCLLILFCVSLSCIFFANLHESNFENAKKAILMQSLWYVLGILVVLGIMRLDEEQLLRVSKTGYFIFSAILFLVIFFYSRAYYLTTGAKSWFAFGPITFQPSELLKPFYILMMSRLLVEDYYNGPHKELCEDFELFYRMAKYTIPIIIMLKAINDFGTTMVYVAIFLGFLIISQCQARFLLGLLFLSFFFFLFLVIAASSKTGQQTLSLLGFKPYQFSRISSWLNPSNDATNQSYQLWQSIQAIGSGQLFGKGISGVFVYVPVRESDMIFSVIGETTGFTGSILVILVFLYLFYLILKCALTSKRIFYAYISTGVLVMLLFHTFENIGMTIGLVPLAGIPMPFVSEGGSSLIANFVGIGLVFSSQYPNVKNIFSSPSWL
ncbi:FtsW/RodA/SpoVE family cell cycle protein [Lacticaseibacillus paracasei]|uniref:FtsW/RodA/SpoVE family cell cycle protein n=1 Tax=Lacticaseibacillus paracasei TaxID=1597 RepID=UPI000FEEA008|nr:FtsW/RodA/SpoVE family cell cycle protein [Lacticaseibacillus paracasei]RWZ59439.1 rod shape-determining protein RodA [Lacticaseibacillus paracasei]